VLGDFVVITHATEMILLYDRTNSYQQPA